MRGFALAVVVTVLAAASAHGATVAPHAFTAGTTATVTFKAKRAGRATLVIQRRTAGRWQRVGRLRRHVRAGRNTVRFTRALVPGRYRLVIRGGGRATFEILDPDFLWGVSASAFQSEGQRCDSNWQRYTDEGTNDVEPYLRSVDFRHRYKQDIKLAAGLGTNLFRFGINWACVEPQPGVFDEAQLAYYDDVVKTIVANGMTPLPTFHHFVVPGWVLDQGGWTNPKTVDDFVAYSTKLVEHFAKDTRYWLIFNEPLCDAVFQLSYGEAGPTDLVTVADRMAQAHERVYDVIHRARPDAMVSTNMCESNLPTAGSLGVDALFTARFVDHGKLDMLAPDVYYRQDSTSIQFLLSGDDPWTVPQIPYAMYEQLTTYHRRYPELPIFVSENGMPTDNGKPRPDGLTRADHLRDNVYWMQRAMAEGVPVVGYSYWSLTDNYEWGSYRPRFGLYTVDAATDPTLTRRPTDAVPAYRCVIATGGVPPDYQPVRDESGKPTGAVNPKPCP